MKGKRGFGKVIKSVIAIGNPIVDISAEVDFGSIKEYGLQWGGTVFINAENEGMFKLLESKKNVSYIPGGSIQNTLRVANWCLNMSMDTKGAYSLTMLGCLGNDDYKEKILKALKEVGVNALMEINNEFPTSRCAVAINKKERSLISSIKASNKITTDFLEKNMKKIVKNDCLMIEGYFLIEKIDLIKYLVAEFKKQNKPIILTISATFIVNNCYSNVIDIAKDSNVIVCNLEEAEAVTGKPGINTMETIELMFKKFGTLKDRLLVVTCGSGGVICSTYDYEHSKLNSMSQFFPKFIKKEDIVDLNGAGDAFLGGFLSQWIQGKDAETCCNAGNIAAGVILKNVGCTFPYNEKINFDE